MGSLGARELKDVLAVSQRFFDFNNVDELRTQTLSILEPVFKADKGNFFLPHQWEPHLDLQGVISLGVDNSYLQDFKIHYHKSDPFLRSLFSFDSSVYTTEELIPIRDLEQTAYYNEFLKPQSIHSQIVFYLRSGDQLLGVIALFRPRTIPTFNKDDKKIARTLVPYLTAALGKTIALRDVSEKENIIESITSGTAYRGILILNESMEIVYINTKARRILSATQNTIPGWQRPISLPTILYTESLSFLKSVQSGSGMQESRELQLSGTDGTMAPVILRMKIIHLPGGRRSLLISTETDQDFPTCNQGLRDFGLTRRELEVISFVCQGLSNREIADKLHISEYTVENHLRSVYPKMKVRNRTALARRVTLLS
ncbi:MAG: LuxR C-terminal-related transcriptional regulator [Syntrophorhabdaceae bacterium]